MLYKTPFHLFDETTVGMTSGFYLAIVEKICRFKNIANENFHSI